MGVQKKHTFCKMKLSYVTKPNEKTVRYLTILLSVFFTFFPVLPRFFLFHVFFTFKSETFFHYISYLVKMKTQLKNIYFEGKNKNILFASNLTKMTIFQPPD